MLLLPGIKLPAASSGLNGSNIGMKQTTFSRKAAKLAKKDRTLDQLPESISASHRRGRRGLRGKIEQIYSGMLRDLRVLCGNI
jgi:hypothetical protein